MKAPSTAAGMRAIAVFEAGKGLLVIALGFGLGRYLHHDLQAAGLALLDRFSIDPDGRLGSSLLHYLDRAQHVDFRLLVAIILAYATIRAVEAYALWYQRSWAPWFVSVSTGIYLPFEIYHFVQHPHRITGLVILGNVLLIGWLLHVEYQNHVARRRAQPLSAAPTHPSEPGNGLHSES